MQLIVDTIFKHNYYIIFKTTPSCFLDGRTSTCFLCVLCRNIQLYAVIFAYVIITILWIAIIATTINANPNILHIVFLVNIYSLYLPCCYVGLQYIHWWCVCFYHHHANVTSGGSIPRWCSVCGLPLSEMVCKLCQLCACHKYFSVNVQ